MNTQELLKKVIFKFPIENGGEYTCTQIMLELQRVKNLDLFTQQLYINVIKYNRHIRNQEYEQLLQVLICAFNEFNLNLSEFNFSEIASIYDNLTNSCDEVFSDNDNILKTIKLYDKTSNQLIALKKTMQSKGAAYFISYILASSTGKFLFNYSSKIQVFNDYWLTYYIMLEYSKIPLSLLSNSDLRLKDTAETCLFYIKMVSNKINLPDFVYTSYGINSLNFYFETKQLSRLIPDIQKYPNLSGIYLDSNYSKIKTRLQFLPERLLRKLNEMNINNSTNLIEIYYNKIPNNLFSNNRALMTASEDFAPLHQELPTEIIDEIKVNAFEVINIGYLLFGDNFTFKKLINNTDFKCIFNVYKQINNTILCNMWESLLNENLKKFTPTELSYSDYKVLCNSILYALTCLYISNKTKFQSFVVKINYMLTLNKHLNESTQKSICNTLLETFSFNYLHDNVRLLMIYYS